MEFGAAKPMLSITTVTNVTSISSNEHTHELTLFFAMTSAPASNRTFAVEEAPPLAA